MPDVDDIALLREFVNNHSESAFATIVQRRVNLVYSVALRLTGNSEDAQDVTQAVFVILARKAAGLRPKTILTGWLYETTRFAAMNFLTRNNRRRRREEEAYMQSNVNDAETVWPQLAPLLESAVSRLNEKDRTLVALRFYENRSMAETAAVLGVNESAVRKRAERAIGKLRAYFSKRGINSTADTLARAISANSIQAAPPALAKSTTAVALAKGAAASTSTLTLIKGALKIMAWTKAKTAIAVGVALILATSTTTVLVKEMKTRATYYNGKPVRYWVDQALWGLSKDNAREIYGTLRRIGAPAAALLVQALTQTNSPTENPTFPASAVRQNAFAGLEQMGPAARSQVPELIELLKHGAKYGQQYGPDQDVRIWATLVLADMGPVASNAIPYLIDESQGAAYAAYAKEALKRIRP